MLRCCVGPPQGKPSHCNKIPSRSTFSISALPDFNLKPSATTLNRSPTFPHHLHFLRKFLTFICFFLLFILKGFPGKLLTGKMMTQNNSEMPQDKRGELLDAYSLKAQETTNPPQDWISVQELLPEPHQLVTYRTEWYQFNGFINGFGDWFMAIGGREFRKVLAWKPLQGE